MFNLLKLYMIIFKSTVYILTSKKKKKEIKKENPKPKQNPNFLQGSKRSMQFFFSP